MDHIPFSDGFPHQKWPLLVSPEIEIQMSLAELQELPYEAGWDPAAFFNADFSPRAHSKPATEIARFAQLWLYFALLSAALETTIKVADFCVQEEDGPVLSTQNLHGLILQYLRRGAEVSEEENNRMRINLSEAAGLSSRLITGLQHGGPMADKVFPGIECPLSILSTTLLYAAPQFWGRESLSTDFGEATLRLWGDRLPIPIALQRLFAARKWCPSDLLRLSKAVSVNGLAYAVTIRRNEAISHERCSVDGCAINTIDEDTYKIRHRSAECNCELIDDTCREACEILAEGTYPLICLDTFSEASRKIKVVPYQPGLRYTAISHVWSDGLGNTKANSIATCQLLHMKNLLESFADTKLIWMDTLCVPLDYEYRKEAIIRMTQTYEEAAQVLVFDSELRCVPHINKPVYEAFARIAISGWMRRVWTLQEGVLAQDLFVEFQDGVMDVTKAAVAFNQATNAKEFELDMVPVEFMMLIGVLTGLRGMRTRDKETQYFINVWNAVRTRRTTRRGDEILCIASMLHLPLRPILEASEYEQRMKAMLSLIEYVPAGILFTPGRKLQIEGYRWAPYSFLQDEPVDRSWATLKRTEKGLRTINSGIFLEHFEGHAFAQTGYYQDQNDWVLRVDIGHTRSIDDIVTELGGRALAILTGADSSQARYPDGVVTGGVLVSITDWEGDGVPQCRYECQISWETQLKDRYTPELIGKCIRTHRPVHWCVG